MTRLLPMRSAWRRRWPLTGCIFLTLGAACSRFESADAVDAGSEGGRDDAGTVDVQAGDGASGDGGGLRCGNETCVPRTEVCCTNDSGTPSCQSPAACQGVPFACTRGADCVDFGPVGATYCCLTLDNGKTTRAFCSPDPTCEQTFHEILCQNRDGYPCPGDAACVATSAYDKQVPLLFHCAGGPKVGP